jgi:hypothetical protein
LDKPAVYRIKVQGVVPESWTDRLGAMGIVSVTSAAATLEGRLPDQAALNGVLDTLYQLRLPLLEVICLPPKRPGVSASHKDEKSKKKYGQHIDLIMKDGKIYKNEL